MYQRVNHDTTIISVYPKYTKDSIEILCPNRHDKIAVAMAQLAEKMLAEAESLDQGTELEMPVVFCEGI